MADSVSRRVTLNDVARLSGVSYQTVSRVINNHPYVAEDTRARVLEAIEQLDYHPNKAAKSLVTRRSQTLAVITYGLDKYGPAQIMINVERAAKEAGYDLIFSNIHETSLESMRAAMESLEGWQVDGILAITPVANILCEELRALCGSVPLVQVDIPLGAQVPSAVIDQRWGSALVTRHLISLGHTRIAAISGPLDWFGAQARHESWRETLREARLTPVASLEGDWTAGSGYQAAGQLLDRGLNFTALVVANDQMALGAIRALRDRGLRIPEDISITGFDDIPEAAYFDPPLTTVRQDFGVLGNKGVEYLMERIADPQAAARQVVIRPALVQRLSTGRPCPERRT